MDPNDLLREYFAAIDKIIDTADIDNYEKARFKNKLVKLKEYYWHCKKHRQQPNLDDIEDYLRKED